MSLVDQVREFFDRLEADLHGLLTSHVAQDVLETAKADASALVQQGKQQVEQIVTEAESDVKQDAQMAAGDVRDVATRITDENPPNGVRTGTPPGQPAAAQTVDNPQHQPTDPANPAEVQAQQQPGQPDQAPASQVAPEQDSGTPEQA